MRAKIGITIKQARYLTAYAMAHKLRPQLSLPSVGLYHFTDANGAEVTASMQTMKVEFEAAQKAEREAKKRRTA